MGAQAAGALIAEKKREEFVQRLRQGGEQHVGQAGPHKVSAHERCDRPCHSCSNPHSLQKTACEDLDAAML